MSADLERRFSGECRADLSEGRRITGYAIRFNSRSVDLGGFVEIIRPEAVKRSLRSPDVHAYWNHNSDRVLGRTGAGTLQIRSDSKGLAVDIDPPRWADDILESIERGDVTGMSFGFRVPDGGDEWEMDEDAGLVLRTVHDMVIREVSPVSKPAYPSTEVQVSQRSLDALREFQRSTAAYKAATARRLRLASL